MKLKRHSLSGLLVFALCVALFGGCCVAYASESGSESNSNTGERLVALTTQAGATAPTQLWVEPSATNGIPSRIYVSTAKVKTGGNPTYSYVYELCLPGGVNLQNCFLSWDSDMSATVGTQTYESGSCPVPALNEKTTYSFKSGNQTLASFGVTTYQGSENVVPVFMEIDESGDNPTIAQMDGSSDHSVTCTGTINIDGTWYDMPKIKGRGNVTWEQADDKRPYNVTLGSKIKFPGVDSAKTKKWSFMAEILDHSLLCNRSGFYLAHTMGIGQDTTSADVWMNGEYQGCYMVTPKTDSFVTDDGFMIEQDNYLEDSVAEGGDPQFKLTGLNESSGWSSCYNRITVKAMGDNLLKVDGVVDESAENKEAAAARIQAWLQDAWDAIRSDTGYNSKGKYYTDYIDIQSFAKMYLMHEYVKSYDVCAGSILFHRDGMTDDDKLIAGPLWDLDNAMGSTYQNSSLGTADDRKNGDRRSGQGDFIANVKEYKTSIYKTLRNHSDFMEEVSRQYNKYHLAFDSLPSDVQNMIDTIEDSAKMNHLKVNEISNNNHKYSSKTTLGTSPYQQVYEATTDSRSDWPIYAANLKTYITTRSLWFANKYYDPNYVCEHEYEAVVTAPTCTTAGFTTYTCKFCSDSYTDNETPVIAHDYVDGACSVCGQHLLTATFECDEGASVTVYETQDLEGACVEDAVSANPRNSDSGLIDCSGDGQINFMVNLEPNYALTSVSAEPDTAFKNFKQPSELGVENYYRLTKVKGDATINVETSALEPEFTNHALLLSGEIGVRFKVVLPEGFDAEDSYMSFSTWSGKSSSMSIADAERTQGPNGEPAYWFTCFVNALELKDTITATYHYKPNLEVKDTYSATEYVAYIDDAEEGQFPKQKELVELVDSLQDYGYYLQESEWTDNSEHEDIQVINPLNESHVQAAQEGVADKRVVKDYEGSGIASIMFGLTLNAQTTINVYVKPEEGATILDSSGIPHGTRMINGEKYYQYDTEQIGAGNLGKDYTVTVTTNLGTASIKASAMSYVYAVLNGNSFSDAKKLAMTAYYNYYEAARAYQEN